MRSIVGSLFVLALAACGTSTPTGSSSGAPNPSGFTGSAVSISDYSFSPSTLTVKAGTTVRWTNTGPSGHTVTSDSSAFDSGTLSGPMGDPYGGMTAGGTFDHTFASAGTFPYHCAIHVQMHGTIIVNP